MANRRGLAKAQPSDYSRARRPTGRGTTKRRVYGESISGLTEAWATVWRSGYSGEEMVEEALGAGGAWTWKEEKKSGERCGGERWGSPLI
jgi:hypothetical protein